MDKLNPFIPQKIGKDVGVQIEDGDLFNFDLDVQPLLTVLIGKILEQTDLELREEEEIKRIREAKADITKRLSDDKFRIKKIEEEEIRLKKDIDNRKGLKLIEKNFKKNTQKKLISKVFAKCILKDLKKNCYNCLSTQGIFICNSVPLVVDSVNQFLINGSENENIIDNKITIFMNSMTDVFNVLSKNKHRSIINQHEENLKQIKLD